MNDDVSSNVLFFRVSRVSNLPPSGHAFAWTALQLLLCLFYLYF